MGNCVSMPALVSKKRVHQLASWLCGTVSSRLGTRLFAIRYDAPACIGAGTVRRHLLRRVAYTAHTGFEPRRTTKGTVPAFVFNRLIPAVPVGGWRCPIIMLGSAMQGGKCWPACTSCRFILFMFFVFIWRVRVRFLLPRTHNPGFRVR